MNIFPIVVGRLGVFEIGVGLFLIVRKIVKSISKLLKKGEKHNA